MPPMIPDPSHISHSWWIMTPNAEITRPPHQQIVATTPALRGPARSSQPPQRAAAEPRNTKNSVYVHPRMFNFQSHVVLTRRPMKLMSAGQATDSVMPMALDNGSQKTEKP